MENYNPAYRFMQIETIRSPVRPSQYGFSHARDDASIRCTDVTVRDRYREQVYPTIDRFETFRILAQG
ncbi:MAG: hypothetical protein NTZ39_00745 [Methanoregula sp.]|nr:hypothetical protein [Methanoregula sp.]